MIKKVSAFILSMVLLFSFSSTVFACDETQTNTYVTQILFGSSALSKQNDDNVKMLMSALYLCSEQSDNQGQEKIDYLKKKRVSGIPALSDLNVRANGLMECSHKSWEYKLSAYQKNQANRKKVLQNTVNKVFDFGLVNNWFGSSSGKCNSFAALLYYSHILSDYLVDNPSDTEVNVNGKLTPAYMGDSSVELNGNKPLFTLEQMKSMGAPFQYSPLDAQGRAGVAFGTIGLDTLKSSDSKENISRIEPSGWKQNKYKDLIGAVNNPGYLFERSHLIAHQFGGSEQENNLITGTQYLNRTTMKDQEKKVRDYIEATGNHVLYRVTPKYKGNNLLASGVQMEAYSIEDGGTLFFNVFCYNIQPGISIDYTNGKNEEAYMTLGTESSLPFAVYNASIENPDLIFEMSKHFEILFEDQKSSGLYLTMMDRIKVIANKARAIGTPTDYKDYITLKKYEHEYAQELITYVPLLLRKEEFFNAVFK